jgi:hypothetical protein
MAEGIADKAALIGRLKETIIYLNNLFSIRKIINKNLE